MFDLINLYLSSSNIRHSGDWEEDDSLEDQENEEKSDTNDEMTDPEK